MLLELRRPQHRDSIALRSNIIWKKSIPLPLPAELPKGFKAEHETTQAEEQGFRVVVVGGARGWFGEGAREEARRAGTT